MAEMILNYNDLTTAGTHFTTLSDEIGGQLPIWGCETGEVDITAYISVLTENAVEIRDNLSQMQAVAQEIVNEVNTVDDQGATHFAKHDATLELLGSQYVNTNVPGATPPPLPIPGGGNGTVVGPPHLDLPPALQPKGGK